jgi:ubiquitin C-terminal hydrolase
VCVASHQGREQLEECLDAYFAAEILEGANAYHCDKCAAKRDAKREPVLTELPRVLSLHLLRFEYNYATGTKKKLKDSLRSIILPLSSRAQHCTALH